VLIMICSTQLMSRTLPYLIWERGMSAILGPSARGQQGGC
jgi:hypothetical protein